MRNEACVALLRGINVGGKNKLSMKALAGIFTGVGCSAVATYIQSGNIVFTAKTPDEVSRAVSAAIETQFGLNVPVILRTATEITTAIAANPYTKDARSEQSLHIMFLSNEPSSEQIAALDPDRSKPDEFIVIGREIHLYLPHGAAKTKLTNAYFDTKLKTVGTQRNWRTVLTLAKMAEELS